MSFHGLSLPEPFARLVSPHYLQACRILWYCGQLVGHRIHVSITHPSQSTHLHYQLGYRTFAFSLSLACEGRNFTTPQYLTRRCRKIGWLKPLSHNYLRVQRHSWSFWSFSHELSIESRPAASLGASGFDTAGGGRCVDLRNFPIAFAMFPGSILNLSLPKIRSHWKTATSTR